VIAGIRVRQASSTACERRDVDDTNAMLQLLATRQCHTMPGMTQDERRRAQDAFARSSATDCRDRRFGMGIDRSNIRYVLTRHAQVVEHYQQGDGRAGRDGWRLECVLLHSGKDFLTWRSIDEVGEEPGPAPEFWPTP